MKEFVVFYTETWDGHEGTALYSAETVEQVAEMFGSDFGNTAGIDYIIEGEYNG